MINDGRCTQEIKSRIGVAKVAFDDDDDSIDSFLQRTGLKEETSTILHLGRGFCMVLKLGYFGKQIRNIRKVLKCGAGNGWRSV
jgi:hypothetical protein